MVDVFPLLTIVSLVASLVVFLLALYQSYQRDQTIRGNYSLFFSVFLSLWILIEVLNHFLVRSSEVIIQFFHMVILLVLAVWMNIRFYWALNTAKKMVVEK